MHILPWNISYILGLGDTFIAAIYDLGANFYYNGNGTEKNYRLSEHYLNIAKQAGLKRAIDKYIEMKKT